MNFVTECYPTPTFCHYPISKIPMILAIPGNPDEMRQIFLCERSQVLLDTELRSQLRHSPHILIRSPWVLLPLGNFFIRKNRASSLTLIPTFLVRTFLRLFFYPVLPGLFLKERFCSSTFLISFETE